MNYESFNSSFKKKYQSFFKEHCPVIKVFRIFKHPQERGTLVYQFIVYNISESKTKFKFEIDNEKSEGAEFYFDKNSMVHEQELDTKSEVKKDRKKSFKYRFQLFAKKDAVFLGVKKLFT